MSIITKKTTEQIEAAGGRRCHKIRQDIILFGVIKIFSSTRFAISHTIQNAQMDEYIKKMKPATKDPKTA